MCGLQKPISAELTLVYKCGICSSTHYVDWKVGRDIGKILCYCGNVLKLEKIQSVRITPQYKGESSKIKTKSSDEIPISLIDGLIGLGYKRGEAKRIITDYAKINPIGNDVDDWFTQLVGNLI